ncbi:hypothetical protein [Streptomyces sp. NPDC047108]|uniref:hypothetical protein n=1 Tax=Streptomyces sp. NPDC047108 TaxID=3155025 RepID=UPI0033D856C8
MPEGDWWRLYIDPRDHPLALKLYPHDPGQLYDRQRSPGFQQSMVDAYRATLDSPEGPARRMNASEYLRMHNLVVAKLDAKPGWSGGQPTSFPLRNTQLSQDLLEEELGGRRLALDLGTYDWPSTAAKPITALETFSTGKPVLQTNYAVGEVPRLVDLAFDRYYTEAAQADNDLSRLAAIGKVVRALQVIHPFHDTNRRLNVHLLLHKLLIEQGFRPVVTPELASLFQGGYSVEQMAETLLRNTEPFRPPIQAPAPQGELITREDELSPRATASEPLPETSVVRERSAGQSPSTAEVDTREVDTREVDTREVDTGEADTGAELEDVAPRGDYRRTGPDTAVLDGTPFSLHEPSADGDRFADTLLSALRHAAPAAVADAGIDSPEAFADWLEEHVTDDDVPAGGLPPLDGGRNIPVDLLEAIGVELNSSQRAQSALLGDVLPASDAGLSPAQRFRLLRRDPSYGGEGDGLLDVVLPKVVSRELGVDIAVVGPDGEVTFHGRPEDGRTTDSAPPAVVVRDGDHYLAGSVTPLRTAPPHDGKATAPPGRAEAGTSRRAPALDDSARSPAYPGARFRNAGESAGSADSPTDPWRDAPGSRVVVEKLVDDQGRTTGLMSFTRDDAAPRRDAYRQASGLRQYTQWWRGTGGELVSTQRRLPVAPDAKVVVWGSHGSGDGRFRGATDGDKPVVFGTDELLAHLKDALPADATDILLTPCFSGADPARQAAVAQRIHEATGLGVHLAEGDVSLTPATDDGEPVRLHTHERADGSPTGFVSSLPENRTSIPQSALPEGRRPAPPAPALRNAEDETAGPGEPGGQTSEPPGVIVEEGEGEAAASQPPLPHSDFLVSAGDPLGGLVSTVPQEPGQQRAGAAWPDSFFDSDSDVSDSDDESDAGSESGAGSGETAGPEAEALPYHKSLRALRTLIVKAMRSPNAGGGEWILRAKIDPGASWTSRDFWGGEVGHVWLELISPLGRSQTFGFYPVEQVTGPSVPGEIICPDGHGGAQEQTTATVGLQEVLRGYRAALARVDASYQLASYNCASFASEIWKAMTGDALPNGMLVPNPASAATTVRIGRDLRQQLDTEEMSSDMEDLIDQISSGRIPPAL